MSPQDWKRLADAVTRRRVELKMDYQRDLATAMGLTSPKVVGQIENASRTSYRPSTLIALERALRWEPGSVEDVLAGGKPTESRPLVIASRRRATTHSLAKMGAAQLVAEITERLTELASRVRSEDPPILIAGRDGVPHAYEVPGVVIADIPPFEEEDDDDQRKAE